MNRLDKANLRFGLNMAISWANMIQGVMVGFWLGVKVTPPLPHWYGPLSGGLSGTILGGFMLTYLVRRWERKVDRRDLAEEMTSEEKAAQEVLRQTNLVIEKMKKFPIWRQPNGIHVHLGDISALVPIHHVGQNPPYIVSAHLNTTGTVIEILVDDPGPILKAWSEYHIAHAVL